MTKDLLGDYKAVYEKLIWAEDYINNVRKEDESFFDDMGIRLRLRFILEEIYRKISILENEDG